MEDSTSNTLQEIDKLKSKISSYRDTLMTLKMGTSLEDYLTMKNEFEALKSQISFIEGLTQKMDEEQHSQNEVYEEQMKQFSVQLTELRQTIKAMNQEILSILNKTSISQSKDETKKDTTLSEKDSKNKTNNKLIPISDFQPADNQSSTVSSQPSYKQLRSLTNQVLQPQKNQESLVSFEQTGFKGDQKDQRYYSQQYFQSINTHPNYTYNGLNNNASAKTPLRIKNNEVQQSPTNNLEENSIPPSINRISENVNTTVLIPTVSDDKNGDTTEANEASNHDSVIKEQTQSHPVVSIENITEHTEPSDFESKKLKNSAFFNFFRKQN